MPPGWGRLSGTAENPGRFLLKKLACPLEKWALRRIYIRGMDFAKCFSCKGFATQIKNPESEGCSGQRIQTGVLLFNLLSAFSGESSTLRRCWFLWTALLHFYDFLPQNTAQLMKTAPCVTLSRNWTKHEVVFTNYWIMPPHIKINQCLFETLDFTVPSFRLAAAAFSSNLEVPQRGGADSRQTRENSAKGESGRGERSVCGRLGVFFVIMFNARKNLE